MRTAIRIFVATALAALGLAAVPASPAMANAPAPYCESGNNRFICDASSTGTTYWTVTFHYLGGSDVTANYTTSGSFLSASCYNTGQWVRVVYSYVSGGVTVVSDPGGFICRSGPWQ